MPPSAEDLAITSARLFDNGDMRSDVRYARPADAAEKLADWKRWTRGSDLSGPSGSARLDYSTTVDGSRELKLWLNWFCGLSLVYTLDEGAIQVAA